MANVDLVRLAGSRGRISQSPTGDVVTAEAEGLFVMLLPETARAYFGD